MSKESNVGSADRIIRIVIGALLIAAPYFTDFAFWSSPLARYAIPLVGLVLIFTALVRFCPLYRIVGVRTCR
ncbi:MAG: YgaP family membrane protein [Hyphomicrobiaceae bacterium]